MVAPLRSRAHTHAASRERCGWLIHHTSALEGSVDSDNVRATFVSRGLRVTRLMHACLTVTLDRDIGGPGACSYCRLPYLRAKPPGTSMNMLSCPSQRGCVPWMCSARAIRSSDPESCHVEREQQRHSLLGDFGGSLGCCKCREVQFGRRLLHDWG